MKCWTFYNVIKKCQLGFLTVEEFKLFLMYRHCWKTFLKLSTTQDSSEMIGHGSVDKVASRLLPKFENFSGQVIEVYKFIEEFENEVCRNEGA